MICILLFFFLFRSILKYFSSHLVFWNFTKVCSGMSLFGSLYGVFSGPLYVEESWPIFLEILNFLKFSSIQFSPLSFWNLLFLDVEIPDFICYLSHFLLPYFLTFFPPTTEWFPQLFPISAIKFLIIGILFLISKSSFYIHVNCFLDIRSPLTSWCYCRGTLGGFFLCIFLFLNCIHFLSSFFYCFHLSFILLGLHLHIARLFLVCWLILSIHHLLIMR